MNVMISIGCSIVGAVIAVVGMLRYVKKDTQEDTRCNTTLKSDVSYIRTSVDDIRLDIKAQDRRIGDIIERVVRVEESSKSAHKRIDELEK